MGMYDYLGEEQIKIFYHPIFNKKDIMTGRPNTWHSGGQLRDFDENSELPLKTWYYKYPDNFIVFDYRWDCNDVWVIKDGKFVEFKSYTELTENDLGEAVYDYYGSELNVHTVSDFYEIKKDEKEAETLRDNYEKKLFPEGVFEAIKNRPDYYDSVKDQWDKVNEDTYGKFNTKWYKEEKFQVEKQLGEYLDCYLCLRLMKDGTVYDWHNPMEEYLTCKQATKEFIENNSNIIDKYFLWLQCSKDEEKNIRELFDEIMS